MAAFLGQVGRRQIDGDSPQRPWLVVIDILPLVFSLAA
jgi:hypothetical protein